MNTTTDYTITIDPLIEALRNFISARINTFFAGTSFDSGTLESPFFDSELSGTLFSHIDENIDINERLIVLIALVPHLLPNFFESIILRCLPSGGDFPEFGGIKSANYRSMMPTGETIQFILAGVDIKQRTNLIRYFGERHFFARKNILWLEEVRDGDPVMSGRIIISQELVNRILFNKEIPPRFGPDFPARRIVTEMAWEDVVLHPNTLHQVNDLSVWLEHHHRFTEDVNLQRKIKPGYRVLFYGPSGTGKTLTAAILGKQFDKDVYRIDLSQIVSKYIGETEKNLESVFRRAEYKNWILFFDEADALFGKRTNVQSAHDKYANQEVSYLLQRVEDYPGLLILASNFKNNLDEAFIRRFHSIIHFPMPNYMERLTLWKKTMPVNVSVDESVNLSELARQYEMSGASILNVVQYSMLQVFARGDTQITQNDFIDGIRKEFLKEEKSV